ncbi:MAG TPA: D-alanyl-D-alanine carboxypeptidase, partial [Candidatus Kapabacteria bacterium]|nr:D-alanyl-D-alanine carboxypeptidase [Candidatus Kapabacteria bacterium]
MQAHAQNIEDLRHDLDSLFHNPEFSNATFGVAIQSLKTGEYLYRLNDAKSLVPASNMKLFTTAEALALLGPDYRYQTKLETVGEIHGHTL